MDCRKAILSTLIYSDIFDYALTFDQLYTYLVSEKRYNRLYVQKQLKKIKNIKSIQGFYVLKGREYLIELRKKRQNESLVKIKKAKQIAKILFHIPTIYFIGISGGVAMENAEKDDDIDLFLIVKRNTTWVTRFLVLLALQFLGVRRKRNEQKVSGKICLNMIIDENALVFPIARHELYTAHEIIQLFPLIDKNKTYYRFLDSNIWVTKFMNHALITRKTCEHVLKQSYISVYTEWFISRGFLEYIARIFQQAIIQKHRTKETVENHFLAFHPIDYRKETLQKYEDLIKKYV